MSEKSILKLKYTMISKFGSEEAWHAYLKEIAVKGGQRSHVGGFKDKKFAKKMGKLGGLARVKNQKVKDME